MKKVAFVFPGQGSQYVGMGKSFYEGFDVARKTYEEAAGVLGFDIAEISFSGPQKKLDSTEITQPALLTASIAALRVLREKVDFTPDFLAGHSLGEYTALVAAGAIDFCDTAALVHLRGRFMQESAAPGTGKMCAIIGLDLDTVTQICNSASINRAACVPANINSPGQIVISGNAPAVDIAIGLAKERGAKMLVPLSVSAPSHSPLMADAAERLEGVLDKVEFKDFTVPVITNVEAEPTTDSSTLKDLLTRQLTSPVRWVEIIEKMEAEGVTDIIEIGPGKVLSGLVKRTTKGISTANLDTTADLDKVIEILKGAEV